ncbi:protein EMBRYO DEFECTIVE 514-like [Cynara cardunculus var. scolymus]|uniref:Copper amine oxidase, N2/N3-terminal n=1 Tax=Cynara cardunculus var. scolymus TaxID=59895 RepID=A0A103Y257_CYNCS|nr:protein EMBRYO DEFECTIVE 514-like [Cynara cardunculus var. scolymus]KVI01145.1 Copper amine oxidase, N2/N3-terminal [Cynara cardunculus var. scolymus]
MAEEAGAPVTAVVETVKDDSSAAPQEMDLETVEPANGGKREREEEVTTESSENGNNAKKPKVDEEEKSVEEEKLEKEAAKTGPVSVGYKSFETSVQIFDYFFKFLHFWPPNLNVNKYEHAMLLDLLKKGHLEAEKKIGAGIHAFQVRYHPQWKSRCFFLVREDESADDFSFRKCVDHILPLPENMTVKSDVNKVLGGGSGGRGGRGGGCGNWRGRGRGGKPRN